jgi:dipeptidyl aminopeptidase/acylaminoacyl peptidase
LPWSKERAALNGEVRSHWISGDRFWYRRWLAPDRAEFIMVDAATGTRRAAFNHRVVAEGLAAALGHDIDPDRLPFTTFAHASDDHAVQVVVDDRQWRCSTLQPECRQEIYSAPEPDSMPSPDGRWIAFVRDNNLWVRSADRGQEFALTTDGELHHGYATAAGNNIVSIEARLNGQPQPPVVAWSPDSTHLLTHRLDERKVRDVSLVQAAPPDGSARPRIHTWRYSMATDPNVAMAEHWIFDIAQRSARRVDLAAVPIGFLTSIEAREAWWSPDGQRVFILARDRYFKKISLHVVDARSGGSRELISESRSTFVEASAIGRRPMVHVLSNGNVVWFSERDRRGRLYLYSATGQLIRQLTKGDWSVRGIVRLDEARGQIYVIGTEREPGRDPYFKSYYRIGFDGSVKLLTPENATHTVAAADDSVFEIGDGPLTTPAQSYGFSPSGNYFLDTYSRPDLPPVTVLRRSDGRFVAEIERTELASLGLDGFSLPERFTALAADGKTPIYGTLFRPGHFDPAKRYPVLDSIYPGPQMTRAFPSFGDSVFDPMYAQAFAQLGFIVVLVDGRGTPGRSKMFLDESYARLEQAGHLDDHISALRQLAARHAWMDLSRVGIYGSSGGGYATARALFSHPGFYKVGVAAAGNHDQRGYLSVWGETYNGPDQDGNYAAAANAALAGNLQGKLLLIHGDMDANVHPALTLQVVDALIKHNKDFELLIVPNAGHRVLQGYALRRAWDFVVRHLMQAVPPENYSLAIPGSPPP